MSWYTKSHETVIPFSYTSSNKRRLINYIRTLKQHHLCNVGKNAEACMHRTAQTIERINSLRRSLTEAQPRLLLLPISFHGLTTATVSLWVHLILSSNLSRKFRTLLQDLFSWHPVTTTQRKLHWLPISERIKYKVACMCFSAINGSGPAYLSELLHVYTPSRTLRSSSDTRMLEIQQYIMASAPSLALDPTFGIQSHKT